MCSIDNPERIMNKIIIVINKSSRLLCNLA